MKTTYTEEYRLLVDLLASARRERRVQQVELARKLGKPQSFVSKYETCERRLDIREFIGVCRALGANPAALMYQAGLVSEDDIKDCLSP